MYEEIKDYEKEVADDATPETSEEAAEQRTDDYDGLSRKIDELSAKVDGIYDAIARVEGMYAAFIDAGAVVKDMTETVTDAAIDAAESVVFDLESLDYTL